MGPGARLVVCELLGVVAIAAAVFVVFSFADVGRDPLDVCAVDAPMEQAQCRAIGGRRRTVREVNMWKFRLEAATRARALRKGGAR